MHQDRYSADPLYKADTSEYRFDRMREPQRPRKTVRISSMISVLFEARFNICMTQFLRFMHLKTKF